MNTLFYYHPIFLEHETEPHPETPRRLNAILARLNTDYDDDLKIETPRRAGIEDAARIHDRAYLFSLEEFCKQGGGYLDADTPVSERSFEAALHALGAVLDGADALVEERARSIFALVRPPGHHARPAAGMGFCLINNIAAAAAYLKERHGFEHILIADFDVHHGNGTQEMFYEDGSIFFLSIHRFPFYPGTGRPDEKGEGSGSGKTHNLPVESGLPPAAFVESFTGALHRAADSHAPEAILVSAGFDAYVEDPVGGLGLLPEHYREIGRGIRHTADRYCHGRVLSSLEGGYSLEGLPACLSAYVKGLD
jgi:acetoin utilization deacetylase AcuC-like enzyme